MTCEIRSLACISDALMEVEMRGLIEQGLSHKDVMMTFHPVCTLHGGGKLMEEGEIYSALTHC